MQERVRVRYSSTAEICAEERNRAAIFSSGTDFDRSTTHSKHFHMIAYQFPVSVPEAVSEGPSILDNVIYHEQP
jgi:hypothetical protein